LGFGITLLLVLFLLYERYAAVDVDVVKEPVDQVAQGRVTPQAVPDKLVSTRKIKPQSSVQPVDARATINAVSQTTAETVKPAKKVTATPKAAQSAVAELYQRKVIPEKPVKKAGKPQTQTQTQTQTQSQTQAVKTDYKEEPIDVAAMLAMTREQMNSAALQDHAAPFISSLSQQAKDAIPTILYQQHEYADNGGQSSVMMNGKSLREGGSPVAGVKIEEILPASVVLNHNGTQFRLRSLNSWVNL